MLREGESWVELKQGLRLIQHPDGCCCGLDSVLLAYFASVEKEDMVCDLGSGSGVLSLLLWAKEPSVSVTGLEYFSRWTDMAARSAAANGLSGQLRFVCGDIREASRLLGRAAFSLVVANPPYLAVGSGRLSPVPERAAARMELLCSLEDVLREASALLCSGGRFALVHRPSRLAEILALAPRYQLTAKRMRLVSATAADGPMLLLLEFRKDAPPGLVCEAGLLLYEENSRVYRPEMREIFAGLPELPKEEKTDV